MKNVSEFSIAHTRIHTHTHTNKTYFRRHVKFFVFFHTEKNIQDTINGKSKFRFICFYFVQKKSHFKFALLLVPYARARPFARCLPLAKNRKTPKICLAKIEDQNKTNNNPNKQKYKKTYEKSKKKNSKHLKYFHIHTQITNIPPRKRNKKNYI